MTLEPWATQQFDARTPKTRQPERERLQQEIEEYIANGGEVTECPPCSFFQDIRSYGETLIF